MDIAPVSVTTHYENLDAEQIESLDFLKAVESALADRYRIVEGDRSQDYFFAWLGFAAATEITAVSAVLGFYEHDSKIDYLLQNYIGFFSPDQLGDSAKSLASALDEEITRRLAQGW